VGDQINLTDVDVEKLNLNTKRAATPETFRKNFAKYGKVNVTEAGGKLKIVVRYHNHVIAGFESKGSLKDIDRGAIKTAIAEKIMGASDAETQRYIENLHASQKRAREAAAAAKKAE
jgi:hypothetical protein